MTFNIRREGRENNAGDLWEARKEPVAAFIRDSKASVAGLQEVKAEQLAFLAKALAPDFAHVGKGRDANGEGEASPIFYRADDLQLLGSETCWISATPDEPGTRHVGAICPRIVTCAAFRQQSGGEFYCFNTHLDYAGMQDLSPDFRVQREQAEILCNLIKKFCGDNPASRVVLGDLNSDATAGAPPVLQHAGYVDVSGGDEISTFVGFDDAHWETTAAFGATQKSVTKIDWIFAKGACIHCYKVMSDKYQASNGELRNYSDHLAVMAELSFEGVSSEMATESKKGCKRSVSEAGLQQESS